MKIKIVVLSFIVVIFIAMCYTVCLSKSTKAYGINLSSNIESLANTECPDYNYVPDRYIEYEKVTATFTANSSGGITIGGITMFGYEANVSVKLSVFMKNCSGKEIGACCDQREIGLCWNIDD